MENSSIPSLRPEQLNELIRSRRSVYTNQFIPGKIIPDEIIFEILENANWAPTHKNTQPWRFMVFAGKGLQKLAGYQAGLYQKLAGEKFKEEKYKKLLKMPMESSHVISLGMKRNLDAHLPEVEEIASVACAVQNIYLSATAYGLGGYWSTGGITYMEEAKSFFNLEKDDRLMGFFYLGYVQIPSVRPSRQPATGKTIWVRD